MAPGVPSHHRYWNVQPNSQGLDAHVASLHKACRLLRATKVYNPPGDGLCFWYALANALWPQNSTHYAKMRQALIAQRRTIEYVQQKMANPSDKQDILAAFATATEIGEDSSEVAFWAQLSQIKTQPQRYELAINDILRQECGHALQCQINWWAVHLPKDRAPIIDHDIWGEGSPVHLLYDHAALHYLHIMESMTTGTYLGPALFRPMGAPIDGQDSDLEIQCAASWETALEFGITWADCPWQPRGTHIQYCKTGLSDKLEDGWQVYDQKQCYMTRDEAQTWNATKLPMHSFPAAAAAPPTSPPPPSDRRTKVYHTMPTENDAEAQDKTGNRHRKKKL